MVAITLLATGVQAAINPIQPGDRMSTGCTLNFVFEDGGGNVYFGMAGHCVSNGDRIGAVGHGEFGTVVYDDQDHRGGLDIALIEVDEDMEARVDASVKGHPDVPAGHTIDLTTGTGDEIGISGYGIATQWHSSTRENRTGILFGDTEEKYCAEIPVSFGDSGGPVFQVESNDALGIVSRIEPENCPGLLLGPTIEGFLNEVDNHGFDLTLRTV